MTDIKAISFYLPAEVLSNNKLASLYPGWTADKILEKTGIRSRYVSAASETALDLAERACQKLFVEYAIDKCLIDFILLCTQSPDYYLPTSACILQDRLGLSKTIGALDFNLGCSGYIYGLSLAKGLISGGVASRILLVTSETYTKHIHPMDKSARTIFGDGASVTLIDSSFFQSIGQLVLGTDGSGYKNLIVSAGGLRTPRSDQTMIPEEDESGNIRTLDNLYMNGPEIFNFTLDVIPKTVDEVLAKNSLTKEDIDLYVFHQANKFMLDVLRRTLKIPREKFYVNMEDIGNTVSSSIPIALVRAQTDGNLKPGMNVMLVGFGVGLSWGAVVMKW